MHDTFNSALRNLLTCLLLLNFAACSSAGKGGGTETRQSSEAWFCQIDETGEGWDCVQDDELARSPVPRRLPQPPAAEPVVEPIVEETPQESAAEPVLTADSAPENPAPAPVENIAGADEAPVAASAEDVAQPSTSPAPSEQPKYLSLAYQPEGQTELTELPADLFVVQLIAMASSEKLTSFLDVNELNDLTAARVEKDGELFYVLILGVYESEAIARDASAELPDALAGTQPWIRKLGSLQIAMIRANDLTTSNEL